MLLLVLLRQRNSLRIVDAFSEFLSAPNGVQLRSLAIEARLRLGDAALQVVLSHARLHQRFAHLCDDGASSIAAWRRTLKQIPERLANVVEHSDRGVRSWGRSCRVTIEPTI